MSDTEDMSEVALSHLRKWNTGKETVSWASLGTSQGNHGGSAAGALPPAGQLDSQRKAQVRRGKGALLPAPSGPVLSSHSRLSAAACVQDAGSLMSCRGLHPLLPLPEPAACHFFLPSSLWRDPRRALVHLHTVGSKPDLLSG